MTELSFIQILIKMQLISKGKSVSAAVEEIWKLLECSSIQILIQLISEGNQSRQVERRSGSFLSAVPFKSSFKFELQFN